MVVRERNAARHATATYTATLFHHATPTQPPARLPHHRTPSTTTMLPRLRSPLSRCAVAAARPLARLYSQTAPPPTPATPAPTASTTPLPEPVPGEQSRRMQAPNRETTWSRSQRPRALGMMGPRFEQTILERQVRISPRRGTTHTDTIYSQRRTPRSN